MKRLNVLIVLVVLGMAAAPSHAEDGAKDPTASSKRSFYLKVDAGISNSPYSSEVDDDEWKTKSDIFSLGFLKQLDPISVFGVYLGGGLTNVHSESKLGNSTIETTGLLLQPEMLVDLFLPTTDPVGFGLLASYLFEVSLETKLKTNVFQTELEEDKHNRLNLSALVFLKTSSRFLPYFLCSLGRPNFGIGTLYEF